MSGSAVWYFPYGEARPGSGNPLTDYRFTGQRLEGTIALYDYGARFYDPALGRFVSADTVVPGPGNPQALNRFAYVLNNPLRYVDPTGHGPDPWEGEGGRELPPLPPPGGGTNWLEGLFQGLGSLLDKALGIRFMLPIPMTPGAEFRPGMSGGDSYNILGPRTGEIDFYVRSNGDIIPARGYRYMHSDARNLSDLKRTMVIPANDDPTGTYVTSAKFDTAPHARNGLQMSIKWSDAGIRLEFDTLQLDDLRVPYGRGGTAAYLEPLTTDYVEYGAGRFPQYVTNRSIRIDNIVGLPEVPTAIVPYGGPYLPLVLKGGGQ